MAKILATQDQESAKILAGAWAEQSELLSLSSGRHPSGGTAACQRVAASTGLSQGRSLR